MLKFLDHSEYRPNRRGFLQVLAWGGAGLIVGCSNSPTTSPTASGSGAPVAEADSLLPSLNAFVKIGADDKVVVVIKHAEFGQGVTTGLTAIVAEELDADWKQMGWEFAPSDVSKYANTNMMVQGTGGSSSIANSWTQLRKAGAAARALLVLAAAELWKVPAAEIQVSQGEISHKSGQKSRFGALAAAAAKQKVPDDLVLKDPKNFKIIGQPLARLDGSDKSRGRAQFTVDFQLPGMQIAMVLHPPQFGAKVKSVDDKAAKAIAGVTEVVTIDRGVAVLAKDFWSANLGRAALKVEWDDAQAEKRGTAELVRDYQELLKKPGAVARDEGKAIETLGSSKNKLELNYEFPYLAHAPMEPLACVGELKDGECHLHYGAQLHTVDQKNVAALLELPMEKVFIHSLFGGGSFGRRAVPDSDFVVECCSILKAMKAKTPVKLMWDRNDDLTGGRYRPMSLHQVKASIDAKGKPEAFFQRLAVQSFLADSPFAALVRNGVDSISVEGTASTSYQFPHLRVEAHMPKVAIPTLWWRSVGHTYNAFVMETLVEALADLAKKDPVQFRRDLLPAKSRLLGALDLAVAKAGPAPKGAGKGRGVALHASFGSFVCEIVDVTVKDAKVDIEKIWCAIDCGTVINPNLVKAQMESGILYGLSATVGEAITLKEGKVEQHNFDRYQVLRMPAVPPIEVHMVVSGEPPTGTGEPGTPPIGPALANAIFHATGKRHTKLPLEIELV